MALLHKSLTSKNEKIKKFKWLVGIEASISAPKSNVTRNKIFDSSNYIKAKDSGKRNTFAKGMIIAT